MSTSNAIVRAVTVLAVCGVFAAAAAPASQVSFRVIYNNEYPAPIGLIEGSSGAFYSTAGNSGPAVFYSVTTQGVGTILASLPAPTFFGAAPVSGPNERLYSSIYSATRTNNALSVTHAPGSQRIYPPQNVGLNMMQNLPDGSLLAVGAGGADSDWGFVRLDANGNAGFITQLPSGQRLLYATYAPDGNYYGITVANGVGSIIRATPAGVVTTLGL